MLLEVGLGTLAARTDRDGEVFERGAARRELVQVWACVVQPDDKEADAVWSPAVFLSIDLSLWIRRVRFRRRNGEAGHDALSAMADTSRLTGTGRLKTILEPMACWRIKLLHGRVRKRTRLNTVREVGSMYLRTRASEVRPAIAMPMWSSIRNIFC